MYYPMPKHGIDQLHRPIRRTHVSVLGTSGVANTGFLGESSDHQSNKNRFLANRCPNVSTRRVK